jgi:hypothetical protein
LTSSPARFASSGRRTDPNGTSSPTQVPYLDLKREITGQFIQTCCSVLRFVCTRVRTSAKRCLWHRELFVEERMTGIAYSVDARDTCCSAIASTNAASMVRTRLGRRAITNSGGLVLHLTEDGDHGAGEDGLQSLHGDGPILGLKRPRLQTLPHRGSDDGAIRGLRVRVELSLLRCLPDHMLLSSLGPTGLLRTRGRR